MVAIIIAACNLDNSSEDSHALVEQFRIVMEVSRTLSPVIFKGPAMYPSDPSEFMRMFPDAYPVGVVPAKSKITDASCLIARMGSGPSIKP